MNTDKIPFVKYHGTGNDFVIIDHTEKQYLDPNNYDLIAAICHRRFGIGADGLMIIEKPSNELHNFEMLYFNSDGKPSTMCGNGGRCITAAFLKRSEHKEQSNLTFSFQNQTYQSTFNKENGWIKLQMQNVSFIEITSAGYILDTGSPHLVQFNDEVNSINVKKQGSVLRYSERFQEEGINVNFCAWNKNELSVRTYERGVENETYSCGTGVVASSISYALKAQLPDGNITIPISTRGGRLSVSFQKNGSRFTDIALSGPTVKICEGYYYV